MKSFAEYLTESKKTYEFKVGVAGELPEGFEDRMEIGLKKYGLTAVSTGKKTPIQERPLDFPQLQNMEVTYFDIELTYPTTTSVLEDYLSNLCTVPRYHLIVRNPNEPQEQYQESTADGEYNVLLTADYSESENNQKQVGTDRVMELLKELETARKEQETNPMEGVPVGESEDIGDAVNNDSPIGSK